MISVNRLIYAGCSSQDFDLICDLSFDSGDGEVSTYLSREAVASETYRGDFRRVSSYKYSEVLAPTITFIDKDFGEFDFDRQRKILKWLTSKDTASFLTVYHEDSEVISYEILGNFIDIQTYKNGNGRVIGFTATFESIAPWALSPLQTITKDVSDPTDNKITINLETDDLQNAVYPRITIQQSNDTIVKINHVMQDNDEDVWIDGTIYHYQKDEQDNMYYWVDTDGIRQSSDSEPSGIDTTSVFIQNIHTDDKSKQTKFTSVVKNNIVNETVTLDGTNRVVSSSRMTGRIFGDDFSWDWLPLYEGKNELSFVGNCTVTVEFRYPIKCGEY